MDAKEGYVELSPLPTCFVTVCNSQDWVHSDFIWSLTAALGFTPMPLTIYRAEHPWDVIRNNMAIKEFLRSGCEIFAKCDSDQVYPIDYFVKMIPLVEKYKVIGPVIFDREEHNDYPALAFKEKTPYWDAEIDVLMETGIQSFPYTHTNNFYAREVLENVSPPWYEAEMSSDGLARANHVDYDFLDKIKQAGYQIYTNCDMVVGHLVSVPLTRDTVVRLRRGIKCRQ